MTVELISYSMVFFLTQFSTILVVPFLPFMVKNFFPDFAISELGLEISYLGSAYFVGYIPGCMFFMLLADKFGRRPVLLLAVLGNAASLLLFGFNINYMWALAARFACGIFGGIISVARTYSAEITNDGNKTLAFAAIGSMSVSGKTSGSIAGGFLSQPASKYTLFQISFFCHFKYLLPSLVGCALGIINFICGLFFLKETLATKGLHKSTSTILNKDKEELMKEETFDEKYKKRKRTFSSCLLCFCYAARKGRDAWKAVQPLFRLKIIVSMFLFGMTPFALIPTAEIIPLLLFNDFAAGGYDVDVTEIGLLVFSSSVTVVIAQVFLYSILTRLIGFLWTFRLTSIAFAAFIVTVPFSPKFVGHVPYSFKHENFTDDCHGDKIAKSITHPSNSVWRIPWTFWVVFAILYSVQTLLRVLYCTGTLALFGSSTTSESRSLINGVGQSFVGISSLVAPLVSTPLMSWTKNNGLSWPLNYHFTFDLVALFVLTTGALSFFLPRSIEIQRNKKANSIASVESQKSMDSFNSQESPKSLKSEKSQASVESLESVGSLESLESLGSVESLESMDSSTEEEKDSVPDETELFLKSVNID